jgi:curved DNA-binding protein CbpA
MSDPQPTATGTLAGTPLAHLLVYALDRHLTGTLVLEAPAGGRSALRFENGVPSKAKTAEPVIYLGRLLLELGAIDEATLNRTLVPVAEQRKLHGQVLLAEHAIDRETLAAALREQLTRQLLWMFSLPPATAYGYYQDTDFLERWGASDAFRLEPLALIWRGVRSYEAAERVEHTVARLAPHVLRLHPEAEPSRFRFAPNEQAVVDVLRAKPQQLVQLVASDLESEATITRIVYTLALTRHLDVGAPPIGIPEPASAFGDVARSIGFDAVRRPSAQPLPAVEDRAAPARVATPPARAPTPPRTATPPVPSGRVSAPPTSAPPASGLGPGSLPQPPSGPAAGESPEVQALKGEIRLRADRAAAQNYYDILAVARDAPTAVIQAAFFQLAKRWHPDRLGADFEDVRTIATGVFARMSEAHNILSDTERRAEYDEVLKSGGGSAEEQEQVQAVLRAATSFQKAEVLLKKNNLVAAEEHARLALDADPRQADYIALHSWIIAQKPERQGQPLDDLIAAMNSAVSIEPNNLRVRWYRGQLLKRAGKDSQAIRDFRFIVDQNPKHLDATREIRLYEMRRANRPSTRPPPRGRTDPNAGRNPADMRTPPGDSKRPGQNKETGGLFGKLFKR